MAEDDASVSNLFKEIDEELRQDKATLLWKQYGWLLISAIVAVIIAVAAYEGWKAYDLSKREALSDKYAAALDLARKEKFAASGDAFKALSDEAGNGYAILARLQEAALLARQKKYQDAANAYFQLAQNSETPQTFRDMALVLGALNGLDVMDAKDISTRLQPLASSASAWRHSAMEVQAYAEAKQGNREKAAELMKNLSEDASAPGGVRQRAGEFAQAYTK